MNPCRAAGGELMAVFDILLSDFIRLMYSSVSSSSMPPHHMMPLQPQEGETNV